MAARIAESLGKYWSEKDRHFAYALDLNGTVFSGLSEPYPHALAQLFGLAYLTPPRPKLWTEVKKRFQPGDKGIPVERWLIAAKRNAGPAEVEKLRKATLETALRFSRRNVYVDRPAWTVLALLDGKVHFPMNERIRSPNHHPKGAH